MKAFFIDRYGSKSRLQFGEMPEPELREDDVLVQVHAAMVESVSGFMGGQTDHYSRLKQLKQPVLIISGDRDPFFPLKNTWLLYRELADAQVAVYPLAGHAPHQQHPNEVAAEVERFLAMK